MKLSLGECSWSYNFIWADKVTVFAVCAFLFLSAFFWSVAFLAIGSMGARHLWRYMGAREFELGLLVTGLVCVVMRSADFVGSGPTYRFFVEGAGNLKSIAVKSLAHHRQGSAPLPTEPSVAPRSTVLMT